MFSKNLKKTLKNVPYSLRKPSYSTANELTPKYDVVVVGGGIVGVASARECLCRHRNLKMAIVEKESKLATHQSGHNSGVIHAGIYYKPGSLKAKLCVEGLQLIYSYCDERKIPYKKVGKLIVATNEVELSNLQELFERGQKNNVKDLELIDGARIKEYEPHCTGIKALWSPHTGITDFVVICNSYAMDFKSLGGDIFYNFHVNGFREAPDADYPVCIETVGGQTLQAKYVLTCGGLYSDVLAELSGCSRDPRIVPFRGEYLLLTPEKQTMIRGNIYPVPDPRFPFLGVHFTPRMDGSVWLGPNAVLAFQREGYTWFDIKFSELWDAVQYAGFRKLAWKYLLAGMEEMIKSIFTSLRVTDLQKFVPTLESSDITRGPTGVRAQALDQNGNLVDDFVFDMGTTNIGKRILHCRNAPSPGATSSQAIAKMIADKLDKQFKLS